ncbi:MAG: prephenate dehydrogenase [Streptococcaceae bacterium]|nr:prephenate dehydrogenase [Streptococcaceae bacterium]
MIDKRVLIVGVGLIGGTIARGFKQNENTYVIGVGRNIERLKMAKSLGIIDEFSTDFSKEALKADVIILATPVKQSLLFMAELANLPFKHQVIISDAGSTKGEIVSAAEHLFAGTALYFIGGHPMAGSHKTGAAASRLDLFENAYYILTPASNVPEAVIVEFQSYLSALKAKFIRLDAKVHDNITSMVSHLPHVLAAGLVLQTKTFSSDFPLAKDLAAGGFRDMTRIASSDPRMWTDILLSNQAIMLERLEECLGQISEIKDLVARGSFDEIMSFFTAAKDFRQTMAIHQNGAIPAFYDLFVDIPDTPGVVHQILGLFVPDDLSIINIKIMETEATGALQLSFKNLDDLLRAKALIKANTLYDCYEM